MSKRSVKPKRVAKRTLLFGLPVPTKAQHDAAVKAMKPFLDIFQAAVDEQVEADFGVNLRKNRKKRQ